MSTSGGPRWTRARLERVLGWCYGRTERGGVDVAAVAAAAGVTPRTVRRWLSGASRRTAAIPSARLIQLLMPPAAVDERAEQTLALAREVVRQWDWPARARRTNPAWREQGWLDPHLVLIVQLHHQPFRQIVVTNGSAKQLSALRRHADVLDTLRVPSRFHGLVVESNVLEQIAPWRVVPAPFVVADRRTKTWTADAPAAVLSTDSSPKTSLSDRVVAQ